jgi:hypothetical protein
LSSNAPTRTAAAGRNRNRSVYAKNGTVGSQTHETRLRPDSASGRRPSDTASAVMVG